MDAPTPLPSNRSFGLLFVIVFAVLGGLVWWRGGTTFGWWFGASLATLLVTLFKPGLLTPANRAWMKLADILNRVVSPVVLGMMFFGLFTPIAWGMRLARRDALKRSYEVQTQTYWIERTPPGPAPADLPNQF
jgi:hypothetical protein